MKIVICASVAFYEHVVAIKNQLEASGVQTVIPKTARAMEAANDYTVRKTWYDNAEDYDKKADLMRAHFDEIANGDAILVVNDEKHNIKGYIGPNVLMEMSLAWYQQKPIYLPNELPVDSAFEEELKGMMPTILNNDLDILLRDARK
jgi:diphthamide synthase subunit DPH2